MEGPTAPKVDPNCVVNSHTEWDPLEEVIVGRVDDATIPEWHVSGKAVWPEKHWDVYKNNAGQSFPKELVQKGERAEGERERARALARMILHGLKWSGLEAHTTAAAPPASNRAAAAATVVCNCCSTYLFCGILFVSDLLTGSMPWYQV